MRRAARIAPILLLLELSEVQPRRIRSLLGRQRAGGWM
jgi:hypothetical protein